MSTTTTCKDKYASMVEDIGPFSIDDLYFDFCTGNGTLNFVETSPNCLNINVRTPVYLNVCVLCLSLFRLTQNNKLDTRGAECDTCN